MSLSVQTSHPLVSDGVDFSSIEDAVLYLIHRKAYEHAAREFTGLSVLDWGCNAGYGLAILQGTAGLLAGLDASKLAVSEARYRLPALADSIRLYEGGTPPFERSCVDVVTSFQVIEHVSNYHEYFSGIAHVLKPPGCVMFTTPNRQLRLLPGMQPWNPYHVTEFSARGLEDLLRRYYKTVRIFGLRGDAEFEAIETARCMRALNAACRKRTRLMRFKSLARKFLRLALPAAAVARVRRLQINPPSDVERRMLASFSTAQLQ